MTRQRRRRLVNILIVVNFAGFVLGGTAMGGLFKDGHVPWYGIAGTVFMFAAVVIPFYREFLAMRRGFESIEQDAIDLQRRQDGRAPGAEVFPPSRTPHQFAQIKNQHVLSIVISLIAWGLLGAEGFLWITRVAAG